MNTPKQLALFGLVSAFAFSASAVADDGWVTDYAEARATAEAEGKSILLNFTGSDW